MTGAIWGEFGVGANDTYARRNPAETMAATNGNGTRRDLQRSYVDGLVGWVIKPAAIGTDDARALARLHLQRIDEACERSLKAGSKSDVLQAHLMETRARIEAAMDAEMTLGG
jgi:enamine deaminase RidA (YjgF/YER057c/UK114 family)